MVSFHPDKTPHQSKILDEATGNFNCRRPGILIVADQKVLIVTSTALTGAWIALAGVSYFVEDFDLVSILSEPNLLRSQGGWYYLMLALWALLAMGGIGVQIRALRKSR